MKTPTTSLLLTAVVLLGSCSKLPPSTVITDHRSHNLVNSTWKPIADLASRNGDNLDHQIKIVSEGRILVSAQAHITNPAGVAVRGACHLLISDGTGPTNGLTEIGRPAIWFTNENAAYDITVPVLGSAVKAPGTYNVVMECQQLAAVGGTTALLANMIVWEGAK